eukprot:gene36043-59079_t
MLLCISRRRAEKAGLRMGNELDRNSGHQRFEAPLGAETLSKAGADEDILDPQSEATGDNDTCKSALREGNVARDAAQRQTETVHRGCSKTVLTRH